jgi:hypothetical protein
VLKAITFEPAERQGDLKPIAIAGNEDYAIYPASCRIWFNFLTYEKPTRD